MALACLAVPLPSQSCWFNATLVINNIKNLSYSTGAAQHGRNVPALLLITICRHHFVACKQMSTLQRACVGASQPDLLWCVWGQTKELLWSSGGPPLLPVIQQHRTCLLFLCLCAIPGFIQTIGTSVKHTLRHGDGALWVVVSACMAQSELIFPLCCKCPAVPEETASLQETSCSAGGRVAIKKNKNKITTLQFGIPQSFLAFQAGHYSRLKKQDNSIHLTASCDSLSIFGKET